MGQSLRVLVLEDRATDAELAVAALRRGGYEVAWRRVEDRAGFDAALEEPWDVVLADYRLPGYTGVDALRTVLERDLDVAFVLVTGVLSDEEAVEAIQLGADDYVLKDRLARLAPAVRRALVRREGRAEQRRARRALGAANRAIFVASAVTEAIIRAPSDEALLPAVCRALADAAGYRNALVLRGDHASPPSLTVVAHAGFDEQGQRALNQAVAPHGPGPRMVEEAHRVGRPVVIDLLADPRAKPYSAEVARQGIASAAVMPLDFGDGGRWILAVNARAPAVFTPEELGFLGEVTNNIALGYRSLREQRLRREAEGAREAALAALRESEARLRDIVEHSTNLFYTHDAQHRLTYVSPNAIDFFGVLPEQALRTWTDFVTDHPANAVAMQRTEAALATGKVQPPYEVQLRHREGHTVWVEVHEAPVVKDGVVVGMVGSLTDITERKRAEAAEDEARRAAEEVRRLEEMNRFRVQFLNTAAHELNTPLTPLALELNLLADGKFGPLNPRQEKAVHILGRNLHRLSQLVGELLEAARLQAGKVRLLRHDVDLAALVREQGDVHAEAAHAAGVALHVDLQGPAVVQADPRRMAQVLSNLISNAVKFTPRGGEVAIVLARRGGQAQVTVADTGIGLTAAQMARLFQPFTQVHDATQAPRGVTGTGLGLYISRGLVEEHGGRLWVESDGPGKGARFTFSLPLGAAEAPGVAERTEQGRAAAAAEVAEPRGGPGAKPA